MASLNSNRQLVALHGDGPKHEVQVEGEKKLQAAVHRRTLDHTGPYIRLLQSRCYQRSYYGAHGLQGTPAASLDALPPVGCVDHPATSFNTKFVHAATNKVRCSMNSVVWTPDGRRCVTGSQQGEFTLWHGTTFSFESQIQGHEAPIRALRFSHNENWLLAADDSGTVKYWKTSYECVKEQSAHKEAVRGLAFSPGDLKFATASDDSTIKVWDFRRCETDVILTGHGGDIKGLDWHPRSSLLASCSKDGLVKLWDARAGGSACLANLHGHKSTVMQVHWNANGNWLLSAGRDQTCKVFDVRTQRELATFKGHARDVTCAAWHPVHEELFMSGSYDGSLIYWLLSRSEPQAEVRGAHEASVWCAAWHPAGHVVTTASADGYTKFWCRARPGDAWRDRERQDQETSAITRGGDGARALPPLNNAAVIPGLAAPNIPAAAAANRLPDDLLLETAPGMPPAGIRPGRAPHSAPHQQRLVPHWQEDASSRPRLPSTRDGKRLYNVHDAGPPHKIMRALQHAPPGAAATSIHGPGPMGGAHTARALGPPPSRASAPPYPRYIAQRVPSQAIGAPPRPLAAPTLPPAGGGSNQPPGFLAGPAPQPWSGAPAGRPPGQAYLPGQRGRGRGRF
ncbi:hypothetical protein WJX72_006740 [[Myrmecia] bisecta]|uniref:Polyadenylation factor subunit 2 n=1 Tax=[Myrmecia] bisecta TaxID=41462 RepID=A0AAW1Q173_9CHLO